MSWNAEIRALPTGTNELEVSLTPYEPPTDPSGGGPSFLWTIHPKRRLHKFLDERRHRRKFGRVSVNDDARAWRRVVVYEGTRVGAPDDDEILT